MKSWYTSETDGGMFISTRIRLARNIKNKPFPSHLDKKTAQEIAAMVFDIFNSGKIKHDFDTFYFNDLSENEKAVLFEKHLVSADFLSKSDLPRGVVISKDETISIMINEEDHLRIQVIYPGFKLKEAYDLARKLDTFINEKTPYEYHEKFGYLTHCPTNTGSGMRASVMLHLPSLTYAGSIDNILSSISKLGFTIRGLYGEGTKAEGNIYQVSNQITLGKTDEEILRNLSDIINKISTSEKDITKQLYQKNDAMFKDRCMRALGILQNAYVLSSSEFIQLASDVRNGIDLGIIKDIDPGALNELLVLTRPANIKKIAKRNLSADERDIFRAQFVRERLKQK
ncbi:MAG: protein arginine kinase [Clostridiaceae bacterium]|nr:protein arginine kinase [Clostridiaceae bacterium]